ncbi:GNAT family N-acetyltransferase [Anatilimnocola sp. NA78]|uniref:GNAT family N-acetyltransferase n=1 Tax=Anatilimnocola sp. NA78 TaxID=3415683 RepID=UPI003CE504E5
MKETTGEIERPYDHIRAEQPEDSLAIDEVVRKAFGQEDEATLVRALRELGLNLLSLVAISQGGIVGHLLFTRLPIVSDDRIWNAVALAPLAVVPAKQRMGVGSGLMQVGLQQLKEQGERIVVVLGHEHYYTRFGFTAAAAEPLSGPFRGPSWMALELAPGALQGVAGQVKYAAPFGC